MDKKICFGKKIRTRLAAALVFPCSLFLKSQFPEEALLEESVGTVINLSCTMIMGSEK